MANNIQQPQSYPPTWKVEKITSMDLPYWKDVMQDVTDIMEQYNNSVRDYHSQPEERKPFIVEILEACFGEKENSRDLYPNKTYSRESEFVHALKNDVILVETEIDVEGLYYKAIDLRKVNDFVSACHLGNGNALCDLNTLRAIHRVYKNEEDYVNL